MRIGNGVAFLFACAFFSAEICIGWYYNAVAGWVCSSVHNDPKISLLILG
jgi:hypothetical protein